MGFIPWPSQDIEDSLDEFFTNRLTLRLMISHIQALNANKNVNSDGEARHRDRSRAWLSTAGEFLHGDLMKKH